MIIGGALVLALAVFLGSYLYRFSGSQGGLEPRPLTSNSSELPLLASAISPDGKYLAYADESGLHLKLIERGEVHSLPTPQGSDISWLSWFPDSTRLLATVAGGQPTVSSVWDISILGGAPRKLRQDAAYASVSPDGSKIAFITGMTARGDRAEIWLMGANGEAPRRVVAGVRGDALWGLSWLPGGKRNLYLRMHVGTDQISTTLESVDVEERKPVVLVSSDRELPGISP